MNNDKRKSRIKETHALWKAILCELNARGPMRWTDLYKTPSVFKICGTNVRFTRALNDLVVEGHIERVRIGEKRGYRITKKGQGFFTHL